MFLGLLLSGNVYAGVNEPGSGPIVSITEVKSHYYENLAEVKKNDKPKKKPEIRTKKDSVMYSGQSKGYPNTLDIRYAKDLALQNKLKKNHKVAIQIQRSL